jgi:hypothetical protein
VDGWSVLLLAWPMSLFVVWPASMSVCELLPKVALSARTV